MILSAGVLSRLIPRFNQEMNLLEIGRRVKSRFDPSCPLELMRESEDWTAQMEGNWMVSLTYLFKGVPFWS